MAGSVPEVVPEQEKLANTSVMFGPDGEQRAIYRKIHMFDVEVGDVSYRESEVEQAGDAIALGEAAGATVGLTICYDLRFPELYRILALRGARVITVPSAFTERTGRDHWEVLIRARAIEDQVFMVAAGQIGFAPAALPQLRALDDRRPLGRGRWRRPPTPSASSPPTSTSRSRTRCATACRRCATAAPRPTAGPRTASRRHVQASAAEPAATTGAP